MSESKWRRYTTDCGRTYVDVSGDPTDCIAMVEPTGEKGVEIGDLIASAPNLLRQRDELLEAAEGIRTCETKPGENETVILIASFDKLMALCTAIANAGKPTGTPSASTLEGLQDAVADSRKARS